MTPANPEYDYTQDKTVWDLYRDGYPEKEAQCPECQSKNIYFDDIRAETSCQSCGLVLYRDYDYCGGRKIILPNREYKEPSIEAVSKIRYEVQSWNRWLIKNHPKIYP